MTSFTRKLFVRSPAAEAQVRDSQSFEYRTAYGRHNTLACFTPAHHNVPKVFGKRQRTPEQACRELCSHPACSRGCVLFRAID